MSDLLRTARSIKPVKVQLKKGGRTAKAMGGGFFGNGGMNGWGNPAGQRSAGPMTPGPAAPVNPASTTATVPNQSFGNAPTSSVGGGPPNFFEQGPVSPAAGSQFVGNYDPNMALKAQQMLSSAASQLGSGQPSFFNKGGKAKSETEGLRNKVVNGRHAYSVDGGTPESGANGSTGDNGGGSSSSDNTSAGNGNNSDNSPVGNGNNSDPFGNNGNGGIGANAGFTSEAAFGNPANTSGPLGFNANAGAQPEQAIANDLGTNTTPAGAAYLSAAMGTQMNGGDIVNGNFNLNGIAPRAGFGDAPNTGVSDFGPRQTIAGDLGAAAMNPQQNPTWASENAPSTNQPFSNEVYAALKNAPAPTDTLNAYNFSPRVNSVAAEAGYQAGLNAGIQPSQVGVGSADVYQMGQDMRPQAPLPDSAFGNTMIDPTGKYTDQALQNMNTATDAVTMLNDPSIAGSLVRAFTPTPTPATPEQQSQINNMYAGAYGNNSVAPDFATADQLARDYQTGATPLAHPGQTADAYLGAGPSASIGRQDYGTSAPSVVGSGSPVDAYGSQGNSQSNSPARADFNNAFAAARAAGQDTFTWTNPITGRTQTYNTQLARASGGNVSHSRPKIIEHALNKTGIAPHDAISSLKRQQGRL